MPKTEHDLEQAIMTIARADTGAGGLVPLSAGQDPPLILWQDLAIDFKPPINAFHVINTGEGGSASADELVCDVQFDSIVKRNSEGLEGQLADRIRAIVTTNALKAEGIDARVRFVRRRPLNVLENGRRRMEMELQVTMKR